MRPVTLFVALIATCICLTTPGFAAESDFNADNSADILFQHNDDGRLLIWKMNNFARTVKIPQSLANSWDVVGKGDFNGDSTADVLYMKNDGTTAIAEMANAARSNLAFPGGINPVWGVQGVGDFNGDGTDDILLRRSTDGITMVWGFTNSIRTKVSWPGGLATFWDVVGTGDFDNDGIDDILCQHSTDGRLLIWKMNNYGRAAVKLPKSLANTWTVVGVGDFNADGTDDVLYRKDTGDTAIAEFSNLNRSALKFPGGIGLPWSVKDVGDYNGDGTDDIFFQRGSDSVTLAWGIVNSARAKVAWPGGLAAEWIVQGAAGESGCTTIVYPDSLNYVAIGASDAIGIGAVPTENGYVYLIEDGLRTFVNNLTASNLGLDVYASGHYTSQFNLYQKTPAINASPDVITIWAGGNEIKDGVSSATFAAELDALLSALSSQTNAEIFIGNLPDMSLLPLVQQYDASVQAMVQQECMAFNNIIAQKALTYGAHVVDLYSGNFVSDPANISGDGFHPSNAGYQIMADLYLQEIEDVVGELSSCTKTCYADSDADGYGNPDVFTNADQCPFGYVNNSSDCNDTLIVVNPDVAEIYDGLDNDCDGFVDEGFNPITCYMDADSDGYGNPLSSMQDVTCYAPFVEDNTDCDDQIKTVYPGATEIANDGVDQDCDGQDLVVDDHGNSTGSATVITLIEASPYGESGSDSGTLETSADIDYFRIDSSQAGNVSFWTEGGGATKCTVYRYIPGSGTYSMTTDARADGCFGGAVFNNMSYTYYIAVESYNSYSGDYSLIVTNDYL